MTAALPFLILDVDEVLQADGLRYGNEQTRVITERVPTVDVHPTQWPRNWHGYGAERRRRDHVTFRTPVRVSRDLFADLSALPAQIVMLTTWCEHSSVLAFLEQATEGVRWFPDAIVLPFPGRADDGSMPAGWKYAALRELLAQDPRPFVWADDWEVPQWGDTADRDFAELPHHLVAPAPGIGLTREHVAGIRAFLADR